MYVAVIDSQMSVIIWAHSAKRKRHTETLIAILHTPPRVK